MIKAKIEQDLKIALKSRDAIKISTLRMMLAEIHNREIDQKGEIADEQVIKILSTSAKRHGESIAQFESGGRSDLVEKEQQELAIIKTYLPQPISSEELEKLIDEVAASVGASGPADFGKVMKEVLSRSSGRVGGAEASAAVKVKLNK